MCRSVSRLPFLVSITATPQASSSTHGHSFSVIDVDIAVPLFHSLETGLTVHRRYLTSSGEEIRKDGC
jgi:hypothetical protein